MSAILFICKQTVSSRLTDVEQPIKILVTPGGMHRPRCSPAPLFVASAHHCAVGANGAEDALLLGLGEAIQGDVEALDACKK